MAKPKAIAEIEITEVPEAIRPFIPEERMYVERPLVSGWTDSKFFDWVWRSNKKDGHCQASGLFIDENESCGGHKGQCHFEPHSKLNLALTGPTGTGKTSGLVNFAARHRLPMYTITPMTSAHAAFGQYVPDPDTGGLRWVKGPAWMIAEFGGVLYVDEMNFLEPAVQSTFFGLADFRRSMMLMEHPIKAVCDTHGFLQNLVDDITGVDHRNCPGIRRWEGPISIPLHRNTLLCASYNPVGAYAGTNQLNAALSNRFTTLSYAYDADIENELVSCPSIVLLGEALRSQPQEIRTPVSTNRLIEFERFIVETADYDLAKRMFLDNFTATEQLTVKTLLEDQFEKSSRQPDGGIFAHFGLTPDED